MDTGIMEWKGMEYHLNEGMDNEGMEWNWNTTAGEWRKDNLNMWPEWKKRNGSEGRGLGWTVQGIRSEA